MTSYMSLLVNNYADRLSSFQKEENTSKDLWLASVESLSKSFVADDGDKHINQLYNTQALLTQTQPIGETRNFASYLVH